MTKKFYIMLLVVLGFFMTPSIAFACGTKSEKACCKKEAASQTEKTACCNKEKKSKSHEGCNGGCKHVSCTSSVVSLALSSPFSVALNSQLFSFSPEKQNYYYSEIFISSDFRSIWLPPKIS
jgi:hypothetical protein